MKYRLQETVMLVLGKPSLGPSLMFANIVRVHLSKAPLECSTQG
jgi:hypothetical protein